MSKKFRVIVADPPWSFKDSLKMSDVKRGAQANYDTMTISDIQQLPIKQFASPQGSLLALWVPSSLLQEGLDAMKSWGFAHKQTYVWVKTKKEPLKEFKKLLVLASKLMHDLESATIKKSSFLTIVKAACVVSMRKFPLESVLAFGMGRLFRQTHEICLIGTNNNQIYKELANKSQRSVSFATNLKHSAKPEHLQDSLDIMFPKGNKLELFARRHRPGWVCLGNEICNGEDIRVSLSKL
jgi:N6-adenosine-specific RNA methylase IME4